MRTQTNATVSDPTSDSVGLGEIGTLLAGLAERNRGSGERAVDEERDRVKFYEEFRVRCEEGVLPAMERVLSRLREAGGGGVVVRRAQVASPPLAARMTLWMSMEGELEGPPRQDRHPYLQLEADVASRSVHVSEGDMWAGAGGGRSGRIADWPLAELTRERITNELVDIIRRSAS